MKIPVEGPFHYAGTQILNDISKCKIYSCHTEYFSKVKKIFFKGKFHNFLRLLLTCVMQYLGVCVKMLNVDNTRMRIGL